MELKICPDGQNKGFGRKSGKEKKERGKERGKGRWWWREKNKETEMK